VKKIKTKATIAELIRAQFNEFKPAERKIATHLLSNYPMAGLVSITELSANSKVSTPTVMRTLNRIGYTSFISFQKALKQELSETLADPLEKHGQWAKDTPKGHILNRVADSVVMNLRHTMNQLSHEVFNKVVDLLADQKNDVHLMGGRITHTFADYMATHLEVIRKGIHRIPLSTSTWPHHLLDMNKNDLLIIFDVRRYEADSLRLAEMAHAKGIIVVLFTDQWLSPIAGCAKYSFPARIEAPSGWDSGVATLFLVEAVIMAVENKLWRKTSSRMKELEKIFDYTGPFARPR
jgi:DNA-binding MurR/RpiR family transcriptional regulator